MSIQFAGSKSADDRRRRRLVANADEAGTDSGEDGVAAAGVSSELVASAAAAPWVPIYEWRIWTYAALIGLVLIGAGFALARPTAFRTELTPVTRHLLQGDRPVLAVLLQTTFCFVAAQMSLLIGWYRAQCKLDFRGYYRVWPWTAAVFGLAALSSATNAHGLFGEIISTTGLIHWRPAIVAWLLPASLMALPLVLLVDRDVRRSRSSLYTLRVAWILALASAGLELFATDLTSMPWAPTARIILPMIVAATVFVGLWLHARIVAYVCPDPPEVSTTTARSQLISATSWVCGLVVWTFGLLAWRRKKAEEPETKPKRGRKKATDEEEDAAPKRKRKTPAKRTTRTRTRTKPVEVEAEEEEEVEEQESYESEEAEESSGYGESEADESEVESDGSEWESEEEAEPEVPVRSNRNSPQPQYNSYRNAPPPREPEPVEDEESDEDSEDAQYRQDSGMTADQLKGMSKRQKREMRRQAKDQQRNQRR